MIKRIVIITIFVLSLIALGVLIPREKHFEELEIEINEAIYPEAGNSKTNSIIEFTVKNDNPYKVSLSSAKLVSFFGESELGTVNIDEISLDANSETIIRIEVLEDWSKAPTTLSDSTPEYSFQASIDDIGDLEISMIKPKKWTVVPLPVEEPKPEEKIPESYLDEFYENIKSGGPPKDGIPPVDWPKYHSIAQADNKINDQDIVFVMEVGGSVYVYPQGILVWHEIVNEEIDGVKYSITYCPLTGSAIGYYGEFKGLETSFGTSGKLINSNLVMYDRATDSYWPQILGMSISGENKGDSLDTFNVVWTRWGLVKATYSDAKVLSDDTGFIRRYYQDPYGRYNESDSYYNVGGPFFPVMNHDPRLESKTVVIGIKIYGEEYAITKKLVTENRIVNFETSDSHLVAFYDEALDSVNVFIRTYANGSLSFRMQDGVIIDEDTGSIWISDGTCISGELSGSKLKQVDHFDVMWFGWSAFYPETGLYEE